MAMQPQPEDAGVILKLATWVTTGIVGLVGAIISLLFKRVVDKHDEEIKTIKDGVTGVKKEVGELRVTLEQDFVSHDAYEQNRRERREEVIAIHTKIDQHASELHHKIEANQGQTNQRLDTIMQVLLRAQGPEAQRGLT